MMSRTLDLNHNVQELCTEYPELAGIMADLGFKDITKPLALATVGKIMTIPGGAAMKNIPMKDVVNVLRAHDFEVAWSEDGDTVQGQKRETETDSAGCTFQKRHAEELCLPADAGGRPGRGQKRFRDQFQ